MYIEETEAEEILSKEKLIDSICDTINNFNSKDIGNENFNLGFRYAIYKVSNLFEKKDKEIERLNNIINELEKYSENMIVDYNEAIEEAVDNIDRFNLLGARSSYREISNKIKELKGSDKE